MIYDGGDGSVGYDDAGRIGGGDDDRAATYDPAILPGIKTAVAVQPLTYDNAPGADAPATATAPAPGSGLNVNAPKPPLDSQAAPAVAPVASAAGFPGAQTTAAVTADSPVADATAPAGGLFASPARVAGVVAVASLALLIIFGLRDDK